MKNGIGEQIQFWGTGTLETGNMAKNYLSFPGLKKGANNLQKNMICNS